MLKLWTIYDHPKDFPNHYVARQFIGETPTDSIVMSSDLDLLRRTLIEMGLTCLTRTDEDNPKILEVWL